METYEALGLTMPHFTGVRLSALNYPTKPCKTRRFKSLSTYLEQCSSNSQIRREQKKTGFGSKHPTHWNNMPGEIDWIEIDLARFIGSHSSVASLLPRMDPADTTVTCFRAPRGGERSATPGSGGTMSGLGMARNPVDELMDDELVTG